MNYVASTRKLSKEFPKIFPNDKGNKNKKNESKTYLTVDCEEGVANYTFISLLLATSNVAALHKYHVEMPTAMRQQHATCCMCNSRR